MGLTFVSPWASACQAPLFPTISRRLLKFMSVVLVMLSNHLILCSLFLLLPSIFPCIRVFSNALGIRRLTYWSFSFSNSPSNEYLGLISFRIDWFDLLAYLSLTLILYYGESNHMITNASEAGKCSLYLDDRAQE